MGAGNQPQIDQQNAEFWDELCGSLAARHLGITDLSPTSLHKFDDWYFAFYPYLENHIPFSLLREKRVLEVGLGYGTVAQRIAESGAVYQGLDIAAGPVGMVNYRLQEAGLAGSAEQGSVLECPFPDESFDYMVAIGCYHHTGDIQRALDESWRILVPGGKLILMIYSAYSYRCWMWNFGQTFRYWMWDRFGIGDSIQWDARTRAAYDPNTSGQVAPATVFTSVTHLKRMTKRWSNLTVRRENAHQEGFFRFFSRRMLLRMLGPWAGLDLYCQLTK